MENMEFFLDHDGLNIHCKLDYPIGMTSVEDRCPLLILEHGLTGHMKERHIVGITEHMNALGFAVLRVELYGHGKSDGKFRKHTVLKWVDQMLTVVDYASKLSFATALYLAGHSQGGVTALLTGALEKDRLKAVILLSPAIILWDMSRKGSMLGIEFDPKQIPDKIRTPNGEIFGGDYFRTAQLLPVEESIRCFDKPVLIVHGDADEAVPVQYSYDAAKLYKNCTLKIIRGENHGYEHHPDEVKAAVGDFLMMLQKQG